MAYRAFTDQAGIAWEVWEAHPALAERRHLRDRRSAERDTAERRTLDVPLRSVGPDLGGWLAFRSTTERRRIPIPARWEELSDVGLRALLGRARSSGAARPPASGGPRAGYSAEHALRQAAALAATDAFAAYGFAFGRYVDTGVGEPELVAFARVAAREMLSRGMPAERFLHALRIANGGIPRSAPRESLGMRIDARVSRATGLFLQEYFRQGSPLTEVAGAAPRRVAVTPLR